MRANQPSAFTAAVCACARRHASRGRAFVWGVALFIPPAVGWAQLAPTPEATPIFFAANGSKESAAGAFAEGSEAVAVGEASHASGASAIAIGAGATALAQQTLAVGHNAVARDLLSVTFGTEAKAEAMYATSLGSRSLTYGDQALAVGYRALAQDIGASALGSFSQATGRLSAAFGYDTRSTGSASLALGVRARATATDSVALGARAVADSANTVSLGRPTAERQLVNLAAGTAPTDAVNVAQLDASTRAFRVAGAGAANAVGPDSTAAGTHSEASGEGGSSFGADSLAAAANALALGRGARVTADNAVAVGGGARADAPATVSFGNGDGVGGPAARRLVNVAEGALTANSRDAVNGGQLFKAMQQTLTWLGAAVRPQDPANVDRAPAFPVRGEAHDDVRSALDALDRRIGEVDGHVRASNTLGVGARAASADAVAVGSAANAGAAGGTALGAGSRVEASASGAVALGAGSIAARANTISVGKPGAERQITDVAAGTQDSDAVNKAQLDAGLSRANGYTDQRQAAMASSFRTYQGEVDDRFRQQDRRIDQQGAMSAAMLNMATSAAGIGSPNRVGVGVGFQSGESALSLGYQRAISVRSAITVSGAYSGGVTAVGIGAGFGW